MKSTDNKIPTVSVIMPSYNCERYIETAINSVISQTFTDWELIILDDGSTDSTLQIIERLADSDERIISAPNEKNMGVARTRNRGLDICRGKYIAFLDSDDVWRADKLKMQIKKAEENGAGLAYSSYAIINSDGNTAKKDYKVPEKIDFTELLKENYVGCSTALVSRAALGEKRFLTDYYHEDYVLWLGLLRDGVKAVGCTETLVEWRYLNNSRSFNKKQSALNRWDIYRNHLKLSRVYSVRLFIAYAFRGIKKYFK